MDQRIVQISIAPRVGHQDLQEIQSDLIRKYSHLRDVVIVPGNPDILNVEPNLAVCEGIASTVAQAAARYVSRNLKDSDVVAVGRGRMVKSVVNGIRFDRTLPGLRIVPMLGFFDARHDPLDANAIAADLQRLTSGQYYILTVPAFTERSDAPTVRSLPLVQQTLSVMAETSFVIVSLGGITEEKLSFLIGLGCSPSQVHNLRKKWKHNFPVGEMVGWPYHANGDPFIDEDLPWQAIGLELAQMKAMVRERSDKKVVCAVGGNRNRFDALRGALEGEAMNVLVTDHITAKFLLSS